MNLKGAVAIVTGSSSGIGAATARAFGAKGCNVVVNYSRSKEGALTVAADIKAAGADAIVVQGDVSDDATCRSLASAALEKWGRIDVLVNNAGATKFVAQTDLEGLLGEDFHRIYGVNVIGAYQMIRACAPAMKSQGNGAVVNVTSTSSLTGMGSSTAYACSKGALNSLTLALARVLGPELRINAVCPGFVDNNWIPSQTDPQMHETVKRVMLSSTPLQRVASSEHIADVILWLTEGANYITGEIIRIDSGTHLGTTGRTLGSSK